jgi:hypothetical protein
MKSILAATALSLSFTFSPALAVEPDTDKAKTTEGTETSDRTPDKTTTTPDSQVDTTKSGETSDRSSSMKADEGMSPEKSDASK